LLRTGLPYTCRPVLLTVGALGSHALKVRAWDQGIGSLLMQVAP
jgi:hypothetical protein